MKCSRKRIMQGAILTNLADAQKNMASAEKVDARGLIQCGCFYGDLAQFREIVKKTHGDSKYAKEYLAIADLMELHFSDECGGEQ